METVISSGVLTARIKSQGAELTSLSNAAGTEFLWQANPDVWPRHAPVLFPIVGKLKDDSYSFNSAVFQLPQHGFARDMDFAVEKASEMSVTMKLRSSAATEKKYPFSFSLSITYSIAGNWLDTAYQVRNEGKRAMPFSIGAHPGFRCPIDKGERYEDYYLEFESDTLVQTPLHNGLRSDGRITVPLRSRRLHLTRSLFNNDALVFDRGQVQRVTLASAQSAHRVTMVCKDWPYFGIWAKKGSAQFVCLEPWFGVADKESTTQIITDKEGIMMLEPDDDFACSFQTSFE